jgi:hypothetical protein
MEVDPPSARCCTRRWVGSRDGGSLLGKPLLDCRPCGNQVNQQCRPVAPHCTFHYECNVNTSVHRRKTLSDTHSDIPELVLGGLACSIRRTGGHGWGSLDLDSSIARAGYRSCGQWRLSFVCSISPRKSGRRFPIHDPIAWLSCKLNKRKSQTLYQHVHHK